MADAAKVGQVPAETDQTPHVILRDFRKLGIDMTNIDFQQHHLRGSSPAAPVKFLISIASSLLLAVNTVSAGEL
ncbi:MAG TPA: hypothetical protein VF798_02010, partial [Burkholderiaceae bacterium]